MRKDQIIARARQTREHHGSYTRSKVSASSTEGMESGDRADLPLQCEPRNFQLHQILVLFKVRKMLTITLQGIQISTMSHSHDKQRILS